MLRPLVLMQLKDKLDFGFLKSKKATIAKIGFSTILFAAICTFIYFLFMLAKKFNIFSLINFVPTSVVTVVFTLMLLLSIFTCTYGLMKSLYFSKDNILLLTFPVSAGTVFLSKLIVYYIYELKKTVLFILPLFLAYGISGGFTFFYYIWLFFILLFIALIPVVLGAILSIPAMYVTFFLRQHKPLQWVVAISLCSLLFFGTIKGISLIPNNINIVGTWGKLFWRIQDFLQMFASTFDPFNKIVLMIIGKYRNFKQTLFTSSTIPTFLVMILLIAIIFGLCMLIVKPLFFKMASKPFEYKKNIATKTKANRPLGKLQTSLKKEMMLNLRTPENLINGFAIFAILPISILLLNKIYSAMDTNLLGVNLTYSFNILVILLIVLSSNALVASLFSKEGATGYLNKTKPAHFNTILLPKLVFNFATVTLSLVATMIILYLESNLGALNIVLVFFSIWLLYAAHLVWSAEMDIMNPQNNQYATTGSHSNNPNETKSSIFAFVLSFLYFGMSILLLGEGVTLAWIKLLCISLLFLSLRLYLFLAKIKIYYKEI